MSLSRTILAGAGAGAVNAFAWVESINTSDWSIGGTVTAITALTAAVCTAVVIGLKQVGPAYAEFKKQVEAANRESLAGQLAESLANQEKMRVSLHELRNEYASEREKHASEAERLMDLTRMLHETIGIQNDEIAKLRTEVDTLNRRIAGLVSASGGPGEVIN